MMPVAVPEMPHIFTMPVAVPDMPLNSEKIPSANKSISEYTAEPSEGASEAAPEPTSEPVVFIKRTYGDNHQQEFSKAMEFMEKVCPDVSILPIAFLKASWFRMMQHILCQIKKDNSSSDSEENSEDGKSIPSDGNEDIMSTGDRNRRVISEVAPFDPAASSSSSSQPAATDLKASSAGAKENQPGAATSTATSSIFPVIDGTDSNSDYDNMRKLTQQSCREVLNIDIIPYLHYIERKAFTQRVPYNRSMKSKDKRIMEYVLKNCNSKPSKTHSPEVGCFCNSLASILSDDVTSGYSVDTGATGAYVSTSLNTPVDLTEAEAYGISAASDSFNPLTAGKSDDRCKLLKQLFMYCLRQFIPTKYKNNATFLLASGYVQLKDRPPADITKLRQCANWFDLILHTIKSQNNKSFLVSFVPSLSEGHQAKYITGSGESRATTDRVNIFRHEGQVVKISREPRNRSNKTKRGFTGEMHDTNDHDFNQEYKFLRTSSQLKRKRNLNRGATTHDGDELSSVVMNDNNGGRTGSGYDNATSDHLTSTKIRIGYTNSDYESGMDVDETFGGFTPYSSSGADAQDVTSNSSISSVQRRGAFGNSNRIYSSVTQRSNTSFEGTPNLNPFIADSPLNTIVATNESDGITRTRSNFSSAGSIVDFPVSTEPGATVSSATLLGSNSFDVSPRTITGLSTLSYHPSHQQGQHSLDLYGNGVANGIGKKLPPHQNQLDHVNSLSNNTQTWQLAARSQYMRVPSLLINNPMQRMVVSNKIGATLKALHPPPIRDEYESFNANTVSFKNKEGSTSDSGSANDEKSSNVNIGMSENSTLSGSNISVNDSTSSYSGGSGSTSSSIYSEYSKTNSDTFIDVNDFGNDEERDKSPHLVVLSMLAGRENMM